MTVERVEAKPGKCFWCQLNNGRYVDKPAYRVERDNGDFIRVADMCEVHFQEFGGFASKVVKIIDVYPEPEDANEHSD